MVRTRPQTPADQRAQWRETYERTPYRNLPWFSARPFPWVSEAANSGWFPRGARVLDVGCGAGTNALYLAKSGLRMSGIDLAPGAIRAAQGRATRLGLDIDFRVGDALRLPYSKGFFGGLVDVGCFHTLPIKLRSSYARELARVLRPAGHYVLAWVAREYGATFGPPHRPSMEEAATTFEEDFLFRRTEFRPASRNPLPAYYALLERRSRSRPGAR